MEAKIETKTLCSFCDNEVKEVNSNDFIIACDTHKELAREEELKFFKEYPKFMETGYPANRLKFK